jgi:phosphoribosylaminoimidazole-succinocarboxamide synthase
MTVQSLYVGREQQIPGLQFVTSGKVRDIYAVDEEHLLFVTSDRVSAFDVIMNEGVPYKGEVLTHIAAWWFEKTADVIANHLVSTDTADVPGLDDEWRERLRGRIMLVRRAKPTSVEWVVRGYIAGSGWKEYQKSQSVCGISLPAGLQLVSRLPEPILTPTTKDDVKDLPLTPSEARERVGGAIYDELHAASLALFARGTEVLARIGVLLADTKFEFGECDGKLILIDEALTPDSSRFWPTEHWTPGRNPPSYDKQILRDWLETLDWNKEYPPPPVDPAVIEKTSAMYLEICEKLTGSAPGGRLGGKLDGVSA